MEFPDLGIHCSYSLCQQLDFLPYPCDRCKKIFCNDHGKPEAHNCTVLIDRVIPSCPICQQVIYVKPGQDPNTVVTRHIDAGCPRENTEVKDKFVCGVKGCNISELSEKYVCPNCKIAFCLKHRLPGDHKCAKQPQPHSTSQQTPNTTDFTSVLKNKIQDTIKKYTSAPPANRKQIITNMKSTASGDVKVPADKRFYLEIVFPIESTVPPKFFFFDQSKRFGQVLDSVAAAGKIKNENNIAGKPKLVLVSMKTGNPIPLGNKLEEAKQYVTSGDAILLEYDVNLQQ